MTDVEYIELDKLNLDKRNPRLSEFGINAKSREEEILKILWDEMAVNELMYSIVSNGFWDYEPLIALKEGENYTVVEGNRRLAAVKLLHNQGSVKIPKHIIDRITPNLLKETSKIPIIEIQSREESWRYVGFKHVNGPAKWGSFAKAQYIAEIHNDYKVPIDEIAYQIGDTNNTAQKLYQGLMVLEQAKTEKVYNYEDVNANRVYFSHLYTGLQREGVRNYLDIKEAEEESKAPVPKEQLKNLGQLLEWLFGSKKNETQSIIKSQNPDLKYLDEVLQSKEATIHLMAGEPLSFAYEMSRANDALFEENILIAKKGLQKARAYLTTGYDGEENLLRVAGSVAQLADDLYDEMDKVRKESLNKSKKSRLTEKE